MEKKYEKEKREEKYIWIEHPDLGKIKVLRKEWENAIPIDEEAYKRMHERNRKKQEEELEWIKKHPLYVEF